MCFESCTELDGNLHYTWTNRWLPSSRNGGELSVATNMRVNVDCIFKGIEMKILLSHNQLGMKPYVTNYYKTLGEK